MRIPIPDRTGRGRRDLHAGRRARRQHRQLRGRPPRREQRRRRRRARRRRRRRAVPRRADRPRVPPGRHPPELTGVRRPRPAPRRRGPLDAVVTVPGSKSIANRALVCAALADGDSRLRGMPGGDDTVAMVRCLQAPRRRRRRWTATTPWSPGPAAGSAAGRVELDAAPGRHDVALRHGARRARPPGRSPSTAPRRCGAPDGARSTTPSPRSASASRRRRRRPPAGHDHRAVDPRRHASRCRGDVSSQYLTALMLIGPLLAGGLRAARCRRRSSRGPTSS